MVVRWSPLGFYLFLCVVLMFHLLCGRCLPLNLEGTALMEFRSKVEFDPYGILENWNPKDSNPCRWSGVHCVDGKVEILNLNGLSLEGVLAPELGKLSHLKSLVLNKNNFFGAIPKEIGELRMLEILDLRGNNFSGTLPAEIGKLLSLKHLLSCDNGLERDISSELENSDTPSNMQFDRNHSLDAERQLNYPIKVGRFFWGSSVQQLRKENSLMVPVKRKVLGFLDLLPKFKLVKGHSFGDKNIHGNILESSAAPYVRRRLLQKDSNLPAASVIVSSVQEIVNIPSMASGSFPAIPNGSKEQSAKSTEPSNPNFCDPPPTSLPSYAGATTQSVNSGERKTTSDKRLGKWIYVLASLSAVVLLMVMGMLLMGRSRGMATIGPWKTGLSGQLQKAFVTGIPKLQRQELEVACEDFSNIIQKYHEFIVFKGTLSSGVEIAVASTIISSSKYWSKRSETHFRKKIDILSRVNHKNFVNLIGYCEEEDPFTRMMVFEYAPNGTLFEHLHVKEFEHLDWGVRMRIIMGITYCLQYMHHELNPPISHPNLQSSSIYLTDDYAAKIAEMDVWKEVVEKKKLSSEGDTDISQYVPSDPGSNVHDYGVLLLEIISGQASYSKEKGSIVDWATEYLNGKCNINYLIDPTLMTFKSDELDVICEVIEKCVYLDLKKRPNMKEVAGKLKEVLTISPDSASPGLSPLWWAELEILSVEAA